MKRRSLGRLTLAALAVMAVGALLFGLFGGMTSSCAAKAFRGAGR